MPYTVTYDPDTSFVVTVVEGKMTLEELKAEEEQSVALAFENGTRKFLVDLADYEASVSTTQLLEFPDRYEKRLKRPIYVAVVEPLSEEAREDARFYETVCRNRGWNVTLFAKRGDAVAWLRERPSG